MQHAINSQMISILHRCHPHKSHSKYFNSQNYNFSSCCNTNKQIETIKNNYGNYNEDDSNQMDVVEFV